MGGAEVDTVQPGPGPGGGAPEHGDHPHHTSCYHHGRNILLYGSPISTSKHNSHLHNTSAVQLRGMEPKPALAPDTAALAVLAKSGTETFRLY